MNTQVVAYPRAVVIVAGGSGKRMGLEYPKQFWPLVGEPVLMHTIRRFFNFDNAILIVLVLPESQVETWQYLCNEHNFVITHQTVIGGSTRYESVRNGLIRVPDGFVVGIHDGVRPFVNSAVLKRCYETAQLAGSAIPVIEVNETLRHLDGQRSAWADRSKFRLVQTPQVFRVGEIRPGYVQPHSDTFTDDAAVYESLGNRVTLVEGNRENIKLTTREDLLLAEFFMANAEL